VVRKRRREIPEADEVDFIVGEFMPNRPAARE